MVGSLPNAATAVPAPARDPLAFTLAILAWSGVILQLWLSLRLAQTNGKSLAAGVAVFLGYFTVLTNIFVCLVLTLRALPAPGRVGRFFAWPQTLACAATSIVLVGLGYHFLLRDIWNPQGLQWLADMLLHYVVPVVFCLYWLIVLPKSTLPFWSPLAWCVYPIIYFICALLRGAAGGAYPYPFIDVTAIGYSQVLQNGIALLLAYLAVGWLLLALCRSVGRIKSRLSA